MAAGLEYKEEQLNYYRICYVVTDILTEGLRIIFKQEWDNRYKTTIGDWKDDPKSGMNFWNGESPRNRGRNALLLTTMRDGDRAEWDCTMLFYAILFSDCIHGLNPVLYSHIDDLRKFRNEEFAHMPRGHLSSTDFQNALLKIKTAFHAAGLSTNRITEIQNQTSFPTEELKDVLDKIEDLRHAVQTMEVELLDRENEVQEIRKQREVLKEQLHGYVLPFCILPPKPAHDFAARESEIDEIIKELKALKSSNDGLSMLYLSGNPGSGKSQLARLAAKRFNDEANEVPSAIPFVMTLNAENSETLLQSYISFARHCKCPEYSVTNTVSSKDLGTDEKILNLKTLISAKIENYTSWLLIVDNVTSVSRVHFHLPDVGNEQWARGQMLITTQDSVCIPVTSSSIQHISVSAGMRPDDARSLLRVLSGVTDAKLEEKVAQVLDFQPLALASAAIYLSQIRLNKSTMGWSDYLKKLERGQRSATETLLFQTNPGYPKSMTKVISLAVEKAMADDKVSHHMFTFLSMCAPNPILLDIIIEYIKEMDEDFEDEDMIITRINRCSLLLFEEEEEEKDCVYIRVHGVVHDVLNSATKHFARDQHVKVAEKVLTSFSRFKDLDSVIIGKRIVPHLKAVILKLQHLLLEPGIPQNSESDLTTLCSNRHVFSALGRVCRNHCDLHAALIYFKVELEIINLSKGCGDSEKATCYNDLGIVHIYQGDLEQGKAYFKNALEMDLKNLGPEHVDVATSYNNLGNVCRKLGEKEEAKRCYELALDIREKKLGADHVNVAISYHNMGGLLSDQGKKTTAKDYYIRGLDICLKNLGPENVKVATFYNNLASVFFDLGEKEKARHNYELALNIRLKKLGTDHVDVAASYNNLGILYCDLGNLERAKDYYELAMNIFLTKLGSEHESVAISYNNLGNVLSKMDVMEKAKDYLVRALDIRIKKLGTEHAAVADSYNNLGIVHKKLGEKELARECHSRALNIRIQNLGAENVKVAASYNSLGWVHRDLGDLKRAKNCNEKALEIRLQKLGPRHVDVATSFSNLGILCHDLGELKVARDHYAHALEIRLEKLGSDHCKVAASYNNLGVVHCDLGDRKKGKLYHKRALKIHLKMLGPDHETVAVSYKNLDVARGNLKGRKKTLKTFLSKPKP